MLWNAESMGIINMIRNERNMGTLKPTFLTYSRPLLCAMIQEKTIDAAKNRIYDAHYDGAEAFGIQLCNLLPEYRNEESLKKIFSFCEGKPIYITSYRGKASEGMSDEECMDLLLMGARCGATLCDVMGDVFGKAEYELSFDPEVIEKQKKLIDEIHALGCEVLMSCHVRCFFDEEKTLVWAKEQIARGTDVVKIVTEANTVEQQQACINTIYRLRKELDHPFLYLASGKYGKLTRQIGPSMGVCMYLCMDHYENVNSKDQPKLRAMKAVRDNMLY